MPILETCKSCGAIKRVTSTCPNCQHGAPVPERITAPFWKKKTG